MFIQLNRQANNNHTLFPTKCIWTVNPLILESNNTIPFCSAVTNRFFTRNFALIFPAHTNTSHLESQFSIIYCYYFKTSNCCLFNWLKITITLLSRCSRFPSAPTLEIDWLITLALDSLLFRLAKFKHFYLNSQLHTALCYGASFFLLSQLRLRCSCSHSRTQPSGLLGGVV